MARRTVVLAIAVLALALAGCGGSDDGGGSSSGGGPLTVSAATSLKKAFTAYGADVKGGTPRFQFAGSDELAAQIEQGARPDVFAAANTKLPTKLYKEGLVEKPVVFATNRLVLAVPAATTKVSSLDDLTASGTTIAAGSPSVPVGIYTREVLGRLPASQRKAIVANIRSNEPDVGGVVGKLTQGAVDAGFVYVTDVVGSGGELKAIELPRSLEPRVAYGAAVVKGSKDAAGAEGFIQGLLTGPGAQDLREAGFGPPPGR
jgi:molybdate transport system substrate-binding protein